MEYDELDLDNESQDVYGQLDELAFLIVIFGSPYAYEKISEKANKEKLIVLKNNYFIQRKTLKKLTEKEALVIVYYRNHRN